MKRIFIAALCLSSVAFAAPPTVVVKDFNFDYEDPSGKGSASEFSYGTAKNVNGVSVEVEKAQDSFLLKVSGTHEGDYELKRAPSLLTEAKTIVLRAFNLSLLERVGLTFDQARFMAPKSEMHLQKFSLDCARDFADGEFMDQLIKGCIKTMGLKSAKFSSGLVADFVESFNEEGINLAAKVGISGLNLKVNAGKFEFNAEVKAQISGKAKGHGQVSYDAEKKLLTIKISEVKFSILNVTSKVFDELKKNESDKMKVKAPYVYLSLN